VIIEGLMAICDKINQWLNQKVEIGTASVLHYYTHDNSTPKTRPEEAPMAPGGGVVVAVGIAVQQQ